MAGKSWGWQEGGDNSWTGTRTRVSDDRAVGVLIDWQQKGPASHGWILPIYGIPNLLPEASKHGGDVYVGNDDVEAPKLGSIVTFLCYKDKQGLGAEECKPRAVSRFLLPSSQVSKLRLPPGEVNPCATYLRSSIFYPELEERGVTLRKYLWEGSRIVFEMWGAPKDIVAAAEEIGVLGKVDAEVLVSTKVAGKQASKDVRQVGEDEIQNLPSGCRTALSLKTADPKQRLAEVLGA
eukprot:TRINITY_DN68605_c0_g1_i1.p1 TRINITY_DN68605_c0_g1~~TRINITY_DN68605_c0_g1_i1.p1  ORF type:complete len:236 (-),score=52.89 TRINITY_DN68605_c0_g1_i1:47-754(-)